MSRVAEDFLSAVATAFDAASPGVVERRIGVVRVWLTPSQRDPAWWTTIFSSDPAVLATGGLYLHWVGPMYVLLAMGAALYFASQGAGRVLWPVLSASARLLVILLGGSLLSLLGAPLWAVCAPRGAAMRPWNGAVSNLSRSFGRNGRCGRQLLPGVCRDPVSIGRPSPWTSH